MATKENVPIELVSFQSHGGATSNRGTTSNGGATSNGSTTSNRSTRGGIPLSGVGRLMAPSSKPHGDSLGRKLTEVKPKMDSELDQLVKVCRTGNVDELTSLLKPDRDDLLNKKNKEGTTPLHEACCYGNLDCVKALLKAGACATMWDIRGFSPVHCSVYNNHLPTLKVLLDFLPPSNFHWSKCDPNCQSQYGEFPLHISCLRGHLEMSQFLVERGADLLAKDGFENTVFHCAASSNNGVLMKWLVGQVDLSDMANVLNSRNKFGQTPAHRASLLGCTMSTSVLSHYPTNFTVKDVAGYTPVDLALLLGNKLCYEICRGDRDPLPLPDTPPSSRASNSKSLDDLSSSQTLSLSGRGLLPQRSLSNGSNCTPPLLKRQPSITGFHRPRNLSIRRSSVKGVVTSDDANMYISKDSALQVRSSIKHKKSRSWDNTQQMIYDTTAYEPPPDILFVPPVERTTLTQENSRFFSESHDIKIRVSPDHWPPKNQPPDPNKVESNPPETPNKIDFCISAAMHLNQPFPRGYTIVSPVFFISCKSPRPCQVLLTLPHAVSLLNSEDKKRLCILSTTTYNPKFQPDSPLCSPSDRSLTQLLSVRLESDHNRVKFKTRLDYPSLFAVAVNNRDHPNDCPLPLRCSLYVSYPVLEPTSSVSGLYVTTYVGMNLKTVDKAVAHQTSKNNNHFEEKHFSLSSETLRVEAGLTNNPLEWVMTSKDRGEFTYTQLALTQDTDKDTYSHHPAYPPHTQFFIEPRKTAAAVKCRVRVLNSEGKEMMYIRVIPFSPSRELTPPPRTTQPHATAPSPPASLTHLPYSNGLGTTV